MHRKIVQIQTGLKEQSDLGLNCLPFLQVTTANSNVRNLVITKTCLYTFDPLKPHFYIVKLGFTGVYIIFLISAKGSNEYPQSMF